MKKNGSSRSNALDDKAVAARFDAQGGQCFYCQKPLLRQAAGKGHPKGDGRFYTKEHVFPIARGGRKDWSNKVFACSPCNTEKAHRAPTYDEVARLRELNRAAPPAPRLLAPATDLALIDQEMGALLARLLATAGATVRDEAGAQSDHEADDPRQEFEAETPSRPGSSSNPLRGMGRLVNLLATIRLSASWLAQARGMLVAISDKFSSPALDKTLAADTLRRLIYLEIIGSNQLLARLWDTTRGTASLPELHRTMGNTEVQRELHIFTEFMGGATEAEQTKVDAALLRKRIVALGASESCKAITKFRNERLAHWQFDPRPKPEPRAPYVEDFMHLSLETLTLIDDADTLVNRYAGRTSLAASESATEAACQLLFAGLHGESETERLALFEKHPSLRATVVPAADYRPGLLHVLNLGRARS
ncbi:MAG: HNH endonuclease [Alphaproteobacteria bacterium]|jgi:hypothetical protein|nr:HNH endonuclease [Alphaproteobacteria bacterium]